MIKFMRENSSYIIDLLENLDKLKFDEKADIAMHQKHVSNDVFENYLGAVRAFKKNIYTGRQQQKRQT